MIHLLALIGLIGGNFAYQSFGQHDYAAAFDRSYFQAVAIGWAWLLNWYVNAQKEEE